jgi:cytochrome P450
MNTSFLTRNLNNCQAFVQVLYHLAASPHYSASLREEVESIVKEAGWTKAALDRMSKVDNFIQESQRMNPVGSSTYTSLDRLFHQLILCTVTLARLALRDFRFSDGTVLPSGTFISVPLHATHHDESRYRDPEVFDPSRFAVSKDGGVGRHHQAVTPSVDYIPWGLGKHAWCVIRFFSATVRLTFVGSPGRFLASAEMKTMLAHIVVSYDVKMENESVRPPNEWFFTACVPHRTAEVLFRKRRA